MNPEQQKTVEALQANWLAEQETALVYRDLAANEPDEKRRGILLRMAEAEERVTRRSVEAGLPARPRNRNSSARLRSRRRRIRES